MGYPGSVQGGPRASPLQVRPASQKPRAVPEDLGFFAFCVRYFTKIPARFPDEQFVWRSALRPPGPEGLVPARFPIALRGAPFGSGHIFLIVVFRIRDDLSVSLLEIRQR